MLVAVSRAVKVSPVDTVTLRALEVIEVVDAEDCMVGEVVVHLDAEERLATHRKLLLKADQGTDVLMVGADVVEQSNHSFTVDSCLDAKVAHVESVLAKSASRKKSVNKLITAAYFHTYIALIFLKRAP